MKGAGSGQSLRPEVRDYLRMVLRETWGYSFTSLESVRSCATATSDFSISIKCYRYYLAPLQIQDDLLNLQRRPEPLRQS